MFVALKVDFTSIKCVDFVSLSTTNIIESCCFLLLGSPMIKYREIISHFHSRMGRGYSNPTGCWCSTNTPNTLQCIMPLLASFLANIIIF